MNPRDASASKKRLGGCRLFQHQIESEQEVLQMEVVYVVKEVEKVLLDFVQLILERSEHRL